MIENIDLWSGTGGAILGSIVTLLGSLLLARKQFEGLNPIFSIGGFKRSKYYWNCKWDWIVEGSDNTQHTIEDRVHFTIDKNNYVKGEGANQLGNYTIFGKANSHCITLFFSGVKDRDKDIAGVIFLIRPPGMKKLHGSWIQLNYEGKILKGNVSLSSG